ncbi:MAG: hypothetical protein L0I85_05025, partial [Staphylococcus equorum]|nr:hypothetical protein [Staphylococcus equorum]
NILSNRQTRNKNIMELTKRAPAVDVEPEKRYAVLIDAGSSGSRAYVYSWVDPATLDVNSEISASVPMISQVGDSKKTKPGISHYSGDKIDDLWNEHLKKLVLHAEEQVPVKEHYRTPVFLLATAGMRLLSENDQKDILMSSCKQLQENSSFYIPECSTHVSVIDGETEGLYGWLALNYLLNNQIFNKREQALSYGFMDMGGASAQIAFAPNRTEMIRHADDLFHVNIRTQNGKTHDWKVFVSSWLGFGANKARNRFSEHLLNKADNPRSQKIMDPCLPKGLNISEGGTAQNSTVEFQGDGDFNKCLKDMYPLLQKGLPCKDDPCLFNGVHVPAIDYNVNRFVGVSEYWYTANDVFKLGGKYDFVKFSNKAKEFCERHWDDIRKNEKDIDTELLQNACFKATWIINILHEGFGVPVGIADMKIKRDGLNDGANNFILHDTAGNNTIEFKTNNNSKLSRRNIHDFLNPFQSAITVNGQELSWTMGRALLYSSSQVKPNSPYAPNVGYWPAGEDTNSNSRFVYGGELYTSVPPNPANLNAIKYAGDPFVSMLTMVVFIIVAIILFLFYNRVNKPQVNFALNTWKNRISWAAGRLLKIFKLKKRRTNTNDPLDEDAARLLEEGNQSINGPSRLPLKHMSSFDSFRSRSSVDLANTTSMVDMKGYLTQMPSRAGSRMGHRDFSGAPSSPVTFSLDDSEGPFNNRDPRKTLRKAASNSRLGQH